MKVKIKKLNSEAKTPNYSHPGDAGMDIYAVSKKEIDKYVEYGTGLSFEIPKDHTMLVFGRSSITEKDLAVANSVGVLDSGYRGELKMRFRRSGPNDYKIGDRIGQIIILPFPAVEFEEVDKLSLDTSRGTGGFGSTGKK